MDTTKNPLPKIIVALPVTDAGGIKAVTAHSIGCMIMTTPAIFMNFLLRTSCDIVSSRTWLVNEAIKKGGTHILFVDYDMEFPSDAALKLLIHKKEIVGASYNKRQLPLESTHKPLEKTDILPETLYKCEYLGLGLTLIDLSIFSNPTFGIDKDGNRTPWFCFGRDSQGALVMGEDCWFANVARDAGYDVWCDPVLSKNVKHLGEYKF